MLILAGFLIGFGSLVVSVPIDSGGQMHAVTAFFNFTAMLIIFGGISGAIIVAFPVEHLKEIPVAIKKSFLKFEDVDMAQLCFEILKMSQKFMNEK